MVVNREHYPNSMEEFFHIPVLKYFLGGTKQVEAFGKMLDKKKKGKWAAPVQESVSKLSDINDTIPPILRTHHRKIAVGAGARYFEKLVREGDAATII